MTVAKKLRALERVDLLRNIASELANRYNVSDIDALLDRLGLQEPYWGDGWEVEAYAKQALRSTSDESLLDLADELQLDTASFSKAIADPPALWREANSFRLFVSHRSQQKVEANKLREALAEHNISAFVAHEDIEPTADWQREIERALRTADAMLAFIAEGFSASPWTQQEIGWMQARKLKVLSFKFDGREDPKGFIAREQSIHRKNRTAASIAKEVGDLLNQDPRTRDKLEYYRDQRAAQELDDEIPF
jgi:hypothetical protein